MVEDKKLSGTTPKGTAVATTEASAAERAANAEAKTLITVAPLTSDGKGVLKAAPSSTLPAGKTFNEVMQAEDAKFSKAASDRKGLQVGETAFSKKAAVQPKEAPVVKKEAAVVKKEAPIVNKEVKK